MYSRKGVKPIGRLAEIFKEIKVKVLKDNKVSNWKELSEKIDYEP